MSAHVAELLKRTEKIKAERAAAQATESLAVAQAALVQAQERYATRLTSRNAYRVTEARWRVEAAREREGGGLQSLAEWAATEGGQAYMDQAPDADLGAEIAERNAARTAPRHPDQARYIPRQFVSVG